MEHEVGNIDLLSLIHHVVMFVNMENVGWCDVLCLPSLPPSGKSMIVPFHNYRHGTSSPVEKFLQTQSWADHQVEVIEVDIKDRVHRFQSPAE
jgi:hypothetical protein